jgi:hypothetical protein
MFEPVWSVCGRWLGVYNFVRKHYTLGTTPAVAAGLKEKPWSLEQVVEMTEAYCFRKISVDTNEGH